jgi:putative oxidoreductase
MFKSDSNEDRELANDSLPESIGKLLLRITIAGLMLFHGYAKIKGGVGGIAGMLEGHGLPTFIAYGVYFGEIVVPIFMILGLLTRLSSLIFVFNMIVAIALAHSGDLLSLNEYGGWAIELPMLYLLGALSIALVGPGNIAIGKKTGLMA